MNDELQYEIAREEFTDEMYELRTRVIERINYLQKEYQLNNNEMIKKIGMANRENSNATKYSKIFHPQKGTNPKAIELIFIKNICKEFNVSFNWLIGKSKIKNKNESYTDVLDKTILSERSISELMRLRDAEKALEEMQEKYVTEIPKERNIYLNEKQKSILINYIIETAYKDNGILDLLVKYLYPNFVAQKITNNFAGKEEKTSFAEQDIAKLFLFNLETGLVDERENFKRYINEFENKRRYINDEHTKFMKRTNKK